MNSYEEIVGWAETIREVVDEGRMPPWYADPRYGHFSNNPRLSDAEKSLIATWVANGCPQGDPADLPEPRQYAEGWQIGQPDQVVYMREEPFVVPPEGVVDYQYFTADPQWTTEKWIEATEIRPNNRAVVHHIRVDVLPENVGQTAPREGIGLFGPGFSPLVCPPGTALHVPARARLIFNVHYTPNGVEQQDRSMIGVRFADPAKIRKIYRCSEVTDNTFRIPPGDPNYPVQASVRFLCDKMLLSVFPHMHTRGKSFRYEAFYPDGTREILLDVPNYDFNWQLTYQFAEPKLMPRGTHLRCVAHYDNSSENRANPDSTKVVTFGQQTWDEMMEGFYTAVDRDQDDACIALVALSLAREEDASNTAASSQPPATSGKP
jgi:hypothetical protein